MPTISFSEGGKGRLLSFGNGHGRKETGLKILSGERQVVRRSFTRGGKFTIGPSEGAGGG